MPATLTARSVESAKSQPNQRLEIPDGTLPGFYLVIQPSGAKSWAVRYRAGDKPRKLTLGPYPRLSLADAREQGRAALRAVSEGRDPAKERITAQEKANEVATLRFDAVVVDFITRYAKPRNRTWRETERLLTRGDVATLQARDIRSISRREFLDVVDRVIERGSPVQANRLVAALRRFFGWAVERGILETSPAANLKMAAVETARDRVLTDGELRAIWLAAGEIGYPFGRAVQLMILTGQRRSEVLEAEWREFDLDRALWTIPRTRAKNNVAHLVPLAPVAIELLRGLPRIGNRFVFTTTGETPFSGVSKGHARLTARAAQHTADGRPLEHWRLHDLRRTFATGCARLGVALHVVEKCLNHTSGSFGGIVAVYQRHDFFNERQAAMTIWERHIAGWTRQELCYSRTQLVPVTDQEHVS